MKRLFLPTILTFLVAIASVAHADDAPETRSYVEWNVKKHVVGMTYEVWKNHSFGLRYMHAHESGAAGPSYGGFTSWLSYGVRPRIVLGKDRGLALGADAVGALAMFGHSGGAAIEIALGVLQHDSLIGVGSAGVFWSLLVFDIGYVLQLKTAPSDLISTHQIGIRINIPVAEYGRVSTEK